MHWFKRIHASKAKSIIFKANLIREDITRLFWAWFFAIPPFLYFRRKFLWKKSHNCLNRFWSRLQNLYWVRWAFSWSHISNEPRPYSSPTRLLTSPSKPGTGPGQLFSIIKPATWSNNPITVLTSITWLNTASFEKFKFIHLQKKATFTEGGREIMNNQLRKINVL